MQRNLFSERHNHHKFMCAIYEGNDGVISEFLKANYNINENQGEALRILLNREDWINAEQLLNAGALTVFQMPQSKIDSNHSLPSGTEMNAIDLLADRGLTREYIASLARMQREENAYHARLQPLPRI